MRTLFEITRICGCIVVFSTSFFFSCSELGNIAENNSESASEWKRQVDYAISLGEIGANNGNRLSLKEYKYVGMINDDAAKKAVVNDIFSDNAHVVVNDVEGKTFGVTRWNNRRLFSDEYKNNLLSTVEERIRVGKTGVLELTWSYNGQPFQSLALVDDGEGIIYDNIASYAVNYKATKAMAKSRKILRRPFTRAETELVNSAFADSIAADTSVRVFVQQDQSQQIELVTGKKAWWYFIEVKSAFNRHGRLAYRSCNADSGQALGWQCQADAKTVSGELNVSDYHEFAWAWAYGNGGTAINIGFAGNGFTITGGEYKAKRTDIHRP